MCRLRMKLNCFLLVVIMNLASNSLGRGAKPRHKQSIVLDTDMAVWVVQRRLSQKLLMFIKQFCVDVHYDLVYAKLTLLMWQYFEWGYNVFLVWVLLIWWRLGQVFSTYLNKEILALFLASRENLILCFWNAIFMLCTWKMQFFFIAATWNFVLLPVCNFNCKTCFIIIFQILTKCAIEAIDRIASAFSVLPT